VCHNFIKRKKDVSNKVGLEVNAEETKNILLAYQQNAEKNDVMKTANRSFENVAQLNYLGTTVFFLNFSTALVGPRLFSVS
jgi:hypothetical protein